MRPARAISEIPHRKISVIVAHRKHSDGGRHEVIINLKVAEAFGVQISDKLLSLADDVIE